jgi:signal peptidase I
MTDLATRLRDVERTDPPDLWPDIASRAPRALPPERHRGRVVAALMAAALVAAGIVAPLTLLRSNDVRRPGSGGTPTGALIAVTVVSTSMEPTLHVGDVVDVDTEAYADHPPAQGDIIVMRLPAYDRVDFIKRVIGLPGDVVEERDGAIYVNGQLLEEPYIDTTQPDTRTLGPWHVEAGHVFVMGDNRVNSNDSRFGLGQIPLRDIVGKVVGIDSGLGGSPSPPPPAGVVSGPSGS